MHNPKTGGSRVIPDTRTENIDTYTETYTPEGGTQQSAEYKIVNNHSIIGGILSKLSFLRTHVAAVWYNKLANITLKQKLDEVDGAVAELNNDLGKQYSLEGGIQIPSGADLNDEKYRIPGNYYCARNNISATLINCPVSNGAFTLKVDYSTGDTYPRQTFKVFDSGKIVARTWDPGSNKWLPEVSYIRDSDLATSTPAKRLIVKDGQSISISYPMQTWVFLSQSDSTCVLIYFTYNRYKILLGELNSNITLNTQNHVLTITNNIGWNILAICLM